MRDKREELDEGDFLSVGRKDAGSGRPGGTLSENRLAVDGLASKEVKSLPVNGRQAANLAYLAPGATPAPGAAAAQEPAVQVRSDFRSTILWLPDVKTDAEGTATVKVKY